MRYYGNDYLQELVREITAARDCVSYQNYALPIERTEVDIGQERQKHNGLVAARDAYTHISDIKDKYSLLIEVLTTYYRSVDEVSTNIVLMTERINSMLDHANESLVRICNILEGVGDYQGECVTDQNIHSARINQQKLCSNRDEFILLAIDAEIEGDCLSLTTIQLYMDYVRRMNFTAFTLSPEDITRLTSIYEYYVQLRFGGGAIGKLGQSTIDNCIQVYELLNPTAKEVTDAFFAEAYAVNNETVNQNISYIKYAIYTAEPEYRDIILHYMPSVHIASFDVTDASGGTCYWPIPFINGDGIRENNAIYINLYEDNSNKVDAFSGFFHEFGHAVDDLSDPILFRSDEIKEELESDLRSHMNSALEQASQYYQTDSEEYALISSLSDEEKQELFDFIIGPQNANVVPPAGNEDLFLPWYKDDENYERMTAAYQYLREYYGYYEFSYDPSTNGCNSTYISSISNAIIASDSYSICSDIVGGLTNNTIGGYYGHSVGTDGTLEGYSYYSEADIYYVINSEFYYWYLFGIPTFNTHCEFFAEMFDFSVRGASLSQTESIFSSGVSEYNRLIGEIYDGIQ